MGFIFAARRISLFNGREKAKAETVFPESKHVPAAQKYVKT
jgi:hypothetical protein